jgi:putative glutamine amidotransferase
MKPVIGITVDHEEQGGYSQYPWVALREHYSKAVVNAGGIPILLPPETDLIDHYSRMCDGILISGGDFDISPELYGDTGQHETVTTKDTRTRFELSLVRRFFELDQPVLGICGGQQLLNVALGGTLIQHIPDEIEKSLPHEQPNPRNETSHFVSIALGTLLGRTVKKSQIAVNSAHHQAVKAVSAPTIINAVAPDGVIEGIEHPGLRFCLGIQWHPEFEITEADTLIFSAFVDACNA